jgi:hypothetical protein
MTDVAQLVGELTLDEKAALTAGVDMWSTARTHPRSSCSPSNTRRRTWREHPEHRVAQRAGRDHFYAEYSIQVCECTGVRTFAAALGVGPDASGPDGGDSTVG